MSITPKKRADARRRATCVRALHRWRERKRNRPPIEQLVAELGTRYPDLPMSIRSLYRWAQQAGDPIDPACLVDDRGGSRVRAWTMRSASITRRWWLKRGSNIRPTKAELRIVDRLDAGDEARRFAQHRLRVARAVLDLERRTRLPINTAARHLADCLRAAEPGIRISRGSAVSWARRYADGGAESVAGMIYRRPAGSQWRPSR